MILFFLFWLTLTKPTLTVVPRVIMVGGAIRVTCRVPRSARNRSVEIGLDSVSSSAHQLDGDATRITWDLVVEHVPCDPGPAFCVIGLVDPLAVIRLDTPVVVAGCDSQERLTW